MILIAVSAKFLRKKFANWCNENYRRDDQRFLSEKIGVWQKKCRLMACIFPIMTVDFHHKN